MNIAKDRINCLRLSLTENITPVLFFKLLDFFGDVENVLNNVADFSLRGGKTKSIKVFSHNDALKEIEKLKKINANFVTFFDSEYPEILRQLKDPPPILYYLGDVNLLNQLSVAIVGSRNASINGQAFAKYIANELIKNDIKIVSGMAKGIDTAAHSASEKDTIAVLAGGVEYIYPAENEKLYKNIINKGGIIVSENSINTTVLPRHFSMRNRIISGLSIGIVVIEAGQKSGAITTAHHALNQGKEIFVSPGSPLDPRCIGSNKLIKDGATMISHVNDILNNLQSLQEIKNRMLEDNKFYRNNANVFARKNIQFSQKNSQLVLDALSEVPVTIEMLMENTNLDIQDICMVLLELELADKITRLSDNRIILKY